MPSALPIERPLDPAEAFFFLLDHVSSMNFVVIAERSGHLDFERLRAALGTLQEEDPLLQVAITRAPGSGRGTGPRFVYGAERPIPLRSADCAADDWPHWIERELATPFVEGEAPLMRCLYLRWGSPARCLLVLTFHHSISDGRSGTELMRRLLTRIATDMPPPARQKQVLAPMHALFPPRFRWAEQEKAAEKAVGLLLQDFRRHGDPAPLPWLSTVSASATPKLLRIVLPPDTLRCLSAESRRNDATVNGALCAAHLLAVFKLLPNDDPTRLFLSCPADLRPYLDPPPPLAPTHLYATVIYSTFAVDRTTAFWELARDVTATMRGLLARGDGHALYLLYNLDAAASGPVGMARFTKRVLGTPHGPSVSNVGRVPVVEADPAVDAISFALSPVPYQTVFSSASTYADRLIVNLMFDSARVADETAQAIARGVEQMLTAGAVP